ncbi:glycerophosphodiester phosphodiesterase [Herbidospora sp. NEAU-GS84]|uniref:glycerophosphodiester phosphodiesterase n=1 Tax=Herbidospora solisilvae TaxID=2696284 RepID=A0A7C9NGT7_9ACTN|nr:glycerophosphodiester phosphodiesterase [Herbidospora solisilvae]NAS24755.1 glycerophosphodiester phosphodiesterase [Herbidospora solisilvae]
MSLTRRGAITVLAAGTAAGALMGTTPASAKRRFGDVTVIGHRGASAVRPEHTLLSYEAAIALGADYIEPDLVSTKDGVLVARHENEIGGTTDVSTRTEFAGRRTTKVIDGRPITGWFTEDFTLAELKTLRATERIPDLRPNNAAFNGLAEIPTLEEVIQLAQRHEVGIYPETKHPTYFDSIGLSLEEPLLDVLDRYGWRRSGDPVIIQSFEVGNLKALRPKTKLKLAQLIDAAGKPFDTATLTYDQMVTREGLREIRTYANGIGVNTRRILPVGPDNRTLPPTTLVRDAHREDLVVHAWTLRNENAQLPADYQFGNPASPAFPRAVGNVMGFAAALFEQEIDGIFADDPSMPRAVLSSDK